MSQLLKDYFSELKISCDERSYDLFDGYMKGILKYNESINLTAIKEPGEFQLKHFVDSAVIVKLDEYMAANAVIDLGTGGGFPGVPLAILSQDKNFTLADSLKKRLKVIEELTEKLGINNVNCVHGRAEEIGQNDKYRESYDLCVSRAVADLAVLAEYCLPLVKNNGYFISYKGKDIDEELDSAKKAIRVLGGEITRVDKVSVAGFDHSLIVIKKIKETPCKYPRQPGKPGKSPIK